MTIGAGPGRRPPRRSGWTGGVRRSVTRVPRTAVLDRSGKGAHPGVAPAGRGGPGTRPRHSVPPRGPPRTHSSSTLPRPRNRPTIDGRPPTDVSDDTPLGPTQVDRPSRSSIRRQKCQGSYSTWKPLRYPRPTPDPCPPFFVAGPSHPQRRGRGRDRQPRGPADRLAGSHSGVGPRTLQTPPPPLPS